MKPILAFTSLCLVLLVSTTGWAQETSRPRIVCPQTGWQNLSPTETQTTLGIIRKSATQISVPQTTNVRSAAVFTPPDRCVRTLNSSEHPPEPPTLLVLYHDTGEYTVITTDQVSRKVYKSDNRIFVNYLEIVRIGKGRFSKATQQIPQGVSVEIMDEQDLNAHTPHLKYIDNMYEKFPKLAQGLKNRNYFLD